MYVHETVLCFIFFLSFAIFFLVYEHLLDTTDNQCKSQYPQYGAAFSCASRAAGSWAVHVAQELDDPGDGCTSKAVGQLMSSTGQARCGQCHLDRFEKVPTTPHALSD